jgi:aminoglycoside phosphotransferase (APT) family kinase protein
MGADAIYAALARIGLVREGERPTLVPLTGGVSSDIYRVDLPEGAICVKRALPRLRVEAEWRAPVERSATEVAWIRVAGAIEPDAVPELCGWDECARLFAMRFLDPQTFPLWKAQLRDGQVEPGTAREVAARLVHVHAATAHDATLARRFATDASFEALRLEPYLRATAAANADCAAALERLADDTARTHTALVHGDVSPKNLLIGPRGPVFLDAECAWYGDPAFDLAFLLNHLLLKCLWRPAGRVAYLCCFDTAVERYLEGVDWEPRDVLEARAARLLPALLLARVDGKSPVEYLTDERARELVRTFARPLLREPTERLERIRSGWASQLAA